MACDHAQYEHYFLLVGDSMNGPWLSYLHVAALLSCVDTFLGNVQMISFFYMELLVRGELP